MNTFSNDCAICICQQVLPLLKSFLGGLSLEHISRDVHAVRFHARKAAVCQTLTRCPSGVQQILIGALILLSIGAWSRKELIETEMIQYFRSLSRKLRRMSLLFKMHF